MSEPETREIAQRLRELRLACDLSPEDMAQMLGVSAEQILAFETGDEDIPVGHLAKAAKACNADLTALLTGADAHLRSWSLVRKGEGVAAERYKAYNYVALASRFHRPAMEPFLVTVPPKDVHDHVNSHPGQEFIHLVEGRLEIQLGEALAVLEPGDSLYFDSRLPHSLRGLDGKQAVFLDVIS